LYELADNIPGFTSTDRLGLTTFGSVLFHMVIILGISFTAPKLASQDDPLPTLEVTLVNSRSDTEPETADFLAQANQDGGGDSDAPVIARSPLPVEPRPLPTKSLPVARIESPMRTDHSRPEPRVMTQKRAAAMEVAMVEPQKLEKKAARQKSKLGLVQSAAAQRERSQLSAEISQFWDEYQKRPRRKFLSARTKEYKYAAYMEAWRTKVETVGNLNYPEQAKKRKITGQLVLDVEVTANGSIHAINIIRPSGFKVLDDAAVRIVRLSAPFQPFPKNIREEADILHITRTWQFVRGNRLTSR
jgi:protein TonB